MKRLYKNLIVLTLLTFTAGLSLYGQIPVVTLNYNGTGLTSGTSVTVPMIISGNVNITSFTLNFTYDSDYLTYVSNTPGGSFTSMSTNIVTVNDTTKKVSMSWFMGSPPWYVYCGSGTTVCTLNFRFNGGSGILDFIESECEISNNSMPPMPYPTVTYNNGSFSGSYGTLNSVAGGGTWSAASTWQENSGGGTQTPSRAFNIVITGLEVTVTGNSKCRSLSINPTGVLKINSGVTLTTLNDCLIR